MQRITWKITVSGRVQGVGFRPFVCRLAETVSVAGTVMNLGGIVEIKAQGSREALLSFVQKIKEVPLPATVETLEIETIASAPLAGFHAIPSDGRPIEPIFPADIAICEACQKELLDSDSRYYHYPYTSCTACGPRYTIIEKLPYDREHTTMKEMAVCPACENAYHDLADRRCHGETISCPHCGPQLWGLAVPDSSQAMEQAIAAVRQGQIIMAKAMGGYQLVCRADVSEAVARLREIKHRGQKPFAVMVNRIEMAETLCQVSDAERQALLSPVRPIVLLARKESVAFPGIADGVPRLGVMLPSTGFYVLLTRGVGVPLVVTSANRSGEPMLYSDEEAVSFYKEHTGLQGFFSYHRDILRPADDSVMKVAAGKTQLIRRTRGFLPEPVLHKGRDGYVLATGADMEPSFCLTGGGRCYPCQASCDWDNEKGEQFLKHTEKDWETMLGLRPQYIVSDAHPGYFSSTWGRQLAEERKLPFLTVQHHHAHALSVMAEHGLQGPALAFVFDGTGYGTDGTIWGGEILRCEGPDMKRLGHLKTTPMIGGDSSMKQAWKSMLCYLADGQLPCPDPRYDLVQRALASHINTIGNSGMGRLFDGVAAWLGLGETNHFKGECPMALETAAQRACQQGRKGTALPWQPIAQAGRLIWQPKALWEGLLESHDTIEEKALGFHQAIADMIVQSALHFGLSQVILSGGCFLNGILLEQTLQALAAHHFAVYINEKVPCGDGGIALGQAYYGLMMGRQA